MESAIFKIDELSGEHTAKLVRHALETLPGIKSFSIDQNTDLVSIKFHPTDISHQILKSEFIHLGLGVTSESTAHSKHDKSKQNKKGAAKKEKHIATLPSQNPNTAHNVKKEALGRNTKH